MSITTLILILTSASALVGLVLLAASRLSGQTRPVGFRKAGQLEPADNNVGTSDDWVRMTADQIVADAMTGRGRKARGRIAALASRLRHCQARVFQAEQNLHDADATLHAARAAAEGQRPPAIFGRPLKLLYALLFTGDLVVITAAILAENARTPPGLALLSAMALATALFVSGKFLGHHAREWMHQFGQHRLGKILLCVFLGLGVFGVSLMVLRLGSIWAWLILSISPALGAAAVMALGPTVEQVQADKRNRAQRRAQKRLVRAQRTLDRLEQAKDRLDAESSYDMRKTALRAEAQLMRLGIDRTRGRLYMIEAIRDCDVIAAAVHGRAAPAVALSDGPDPVNVDVLDAPAPSGALSEPPAAGVHCDRDFSDSASGNGTRPVGAAPSSG